MLTRKFSICAVLFALTARTLAQCSDPCSASDDDSVSLDTLDASAGADFNEDLNSAIGADSDLARRLRRRQDSSNEALCCSAAEECSTLDDGTPFCYDNATTEFRFGDGTYGYVANSSYYDADGSEVDLAADQTSSVEIPAQTLTSGSAAAATLSTDSTATSVRGRASSETLPTATSGASPSTTKAQAKQTTTRNSGSSNGEQKNVANVGSGKVAAAIALVMACSMGISHFV